MAADLSLCDADQGWPQEWSTSTKAALFQDRERLGSKPLRVFYERVAVSLTDLQVPGGFYRPWQLMSIDGLTLDVP